MFGSFSSVLTHLPDWLAGLRLTAVSSVFSFGIAFVLGVLGATARRSPMWPLRFVGAVYVETIRNTPVLLQIFIAYFGLPALGWHLTAFSAGVAALSINAGAYLTEIMRAGLQSVPSGQVEAARALALGNLHIFRHVVFPQAMRYVYPPVINQFVQIILGSSLLSTVALQELTGTAETINSQTLETMQVFTVALVLYLLLTNLVSLGADLVARHAFHPPLNVRTSMSTPWWRRRLLPTRGA